MKNMSSVIMIANYQQNYSIGNAVGIKRISGSVLAFAEYYGRSFSLRSVWPHEQSHVHHHGYISCQLVISALLMHKTYSP